MDDTGEGTALGTFASFGALALGVAAGAIVMSRILRSRWRTDVSYEPRSSALTTTERQALDEAREPASLDAVVTDIDLADRYDRYSG